MNFHDFWGVHLEGAGRLIQSWMRRAEASLTRDEPFEAFIFTWIAFNGWAERVTGEDRDWRFIAALAACPVIRNDFDWFLRENSEARDSAAKLAEFGPIFRARDQRAVPAPPTNRRTQRVAHWLALGIKHRPACFISHPNGLPRDWPHLLHAVYQVRCNLFHGEKSVLSDADRALVTWAARILLPFMNHTGYVDSQPKHTFATHS